MLEHAVYITDNEVPAIRIGTKAHQHRRSRQRALRLPRKATRTSSKQRYGHADPPQFATPMRQHMRDRRHPSTHPALPLPVRVVCD